MNILSHSILAILALASIIAVSNAGLAAASNKPIPGWSTINPYDRPDAHVVISVLTPYITSIKALGNWGQTCKGACAEARKTFPMAASKRLEACLLDKDVYRMAENLCAIRRDFYENLAKYDMEPLQIPSCFNPTYTPKKHARCLYNLWQLASQGLLRSDWVILSLKDLAHAAAVGFERGGQANPHWCSRVAIDQKELLLAKIQPDDEWSIDAYHVLILILQGMKRNEDLIDSRAAILSALQHARPVLFCRMVKDAIKLHVDTKLQRVTGGVTTLEAVLSHIFNILTKTMEEYPYFPANSLVYHGHEFNPLEDIRKCGNVGLGDIINGLVGVIHPPISVDDKNYLVRKLMHETLPVGSGLSDFSYQLLENFPNSNLAIAAKDRIIVAIISALEQRLPSQGIPNTNDGSISEYQIAEWFSWQWWCLMLKHITANDRASVALQILQFLKWKKLMPKWVNLALLKNELEALVKPSR